MLVPPVGIGLVWLRPFPVGAGAVRRGAGVVGRLVATGLLVVLTLLYLVRFGVLHAEMSGAGWLPIFSLRDPKLDEVALEQHRAQMKAATPAPVAVPPGTSSASAVKSDSPAAAKSVAPAVAAPVAAPWGEFRGARRDGIYTEGPILTAWPDDGLKPLWRQPSGGGYASFAVAEGRAFTIEQRREKEVVVAYDVQSGREVWTHDWPARFSEAMGGDGPRATPTWHNGRVYALGAAGELRVLDAATGKQVWAKNILSATGAPNIMWGMSNSPLIVGDKVVVTPGGSPAKSIVAYNKETGEQVWGALDDRAAYTSPALETIAGHRQIVLATATRIVGLQPETGALLWEYPWVTMYDVNSAQPIVIGGNRLFVSAGYDHGSIMLEISRGESGFTAQRIWENKNLKNRFNSSVLREGFLYGFDEAIFACIDARTGERKWKGGRYGYGQAILAGDHIVILTESGELALIKASPDAHQEIARFSAIEGKTWNLPALAGGILLVRNAREMAAFDLTPR
jgi:outer membrane protein assembly factor BamB